MNETKMSFLAIDAWADCSSWVWNAWHKLGEISENEFDVFSDNWQVFEYLIDAKIDKRKYRIEDDGYNIVLCKRKKPFSDSLPNRPIYAIQYGYLL